MVLEEGNSKLHTEEQCLSSASKENCFDLRNNILSIANNSSHVQWGVCCATSVLCRDSTSLSSTNKHLQMQRALILYKGVAVSEVLM